MMWYAIKYVLEVHVVFGLRDTWRIFKEECKIAFSLES